MAFALLIVGMSLVVVSVRNTQATFTARVANDFKGSGNFLYWIVAILIIGAIGYIPKACNEALLDAMNCAIVSVTVESVGCAGKTNVLGAILRIKISFPDN